MSQNEKEKEEDLQLLQRSNEMVIFLTTKCPVDFNSEMATCIYFQCFFLIKTFQPAKAKCEYANDEAKK